MTAHAKGSMQWKRGLRLSPSRKHVKEQHHDHPNKSITKACQVLHAAVDASVNICQLGHKLGGVAF